VLLVHADETLTDTATHRLEEVFAADDATGKLQAVWTVKEQLRMLLRTNAMADATDAKVELKALVGAAGRPKTKKIYRTVCRWCNEIKVPIITGTTTGNVEANNIGIKHIKPTTRGYRNAGIYKSIILMTRAVRAAA